MLTRIKDPTERALTGRRFRQSLNRLHGPAQFDSGPSDVIVMTPVLNGAWYLPEFRRHCRALGARHFVFLDNGSTDATVAMLAELARPSLYHVALRALAAQTGAAIAPEVYRMDAPHSADPAVMAAWTMVYRNPEKWWSLYDLAEKLFDLEDYFRRWRFNHVTTVERVIGFKRGTGGTSGVQYLRRMLAVELFPELWHLRGDL
jgi:tryptophan 2,3-dioxygenase